MHFVLVKKFKTPENVFFTTILVHPKRHGKSLPDARGINVVVWQVIKQLCREV